MMASKIEHTEIGRARPSSPREKFVHHARGVMATDYDDWRRIEQSEVARARPGSPREKFVRIADWLEALGR